MTHKTGSTLGARLAEVRRARSLTAQELADRSGVSRSIVANVETGRKEDLPMSQFVALAAALDVSPGYLMFDMKRPFDEIQLAEGVAPMAAWEAAKWWMGTERLATGNEENEGALPLPHALGSLDEAITMLTARRGVLQNLRQLSETPPEDEAFAHRLWAVFAARLANTDAALRDLGMVVPHTVISAELDARID